MQTFKVILKDVTTHQQREVHVESTGVELAHRDAYFNHADKYEEILSIAGSNGDILYTEENGFSTMPSFTPQENVPEEIPTLPVDALPEEEGGGFERSSAKVNLF